MKERWKKLLRWSKHPHGWGLLLIVLVFALSLTADVLFIRFSPNGTAFETLAYIFYGVSALLLGYLVYVTVVLVKDGYRRVSERSYLLGRMRREFEFRTILFSVGSFFTAALVSAYYWLLFGLTLSLWYGALGGYYSVLMLARGGVLYSRRLGRKRGEDDAHIRLRDAKSYLASGGMLVLLALSFSGMLILTVVYGQHNEYAGITIFIAAAYAFLKIGFAITNFVKAHKREDLTVRTLRNINVSDALVSVVALQSAMLQMFMTETDALDSHLFNAVTGGIVCVLIVAIGSVMIVRGKRSLDRLEGGEDASKA